MSNNKINVQAISNEIGVVYGFAEWMGKMASNLRCIDDIFQLQEAARTFDWLVDVTMTVPNTEEDEVVAKEQPYSENADHSDNADNGMSEEMARALIKIYNAWDQGML